MLLSEAVDISVTEFMKQRAKDVRILISAYLKTSGSVVKSEIIGFLK